MNVCRKFAYSLVAMMLTLTIYMFAWDTAQGRRVEVLQLAPVSISMRQHTMPKAVRARLPHE